MMDDESTFTGSQEALLQALVGEDAAKLIDEEIALSVMEFLSENGARIRPVAGQSDSLEVRVGGPVFISVRKFVWGSAAAILGLAVAIVTGNPIASAAQVAGNLLLSISVFSPDTTEFKAYSATAALQKTNPQSSPSVLEIGSWLDASGEQISEKELERGLNALIDRQLLRRAGEDHVRIVW